MNGENRKILVRNIGKPSGLTLDYEQQHIYWADIIQHTIERVDFSGQNKVKLLKSVPHPYGLTMYSKFVYFSDWVTKTIERADKETGHNRTRILDNLEYVMDVLAYHRSRQTGLL